jgi:hypothetical protein
LTLAEIAGSAVPPPSPPWRSEIEPEAYAAGARAAQQHVEPLVRSLLPFKFPGDRAAAEMCRDEQSELVPDDQLDEVGWEIYLLARARGGEHAYAVRQAMDGNLRDRRRVRQDFLERAPRPPRPLSRNASGRHR